MPGLSRKADIAGSVRQAVGTLPNGPPTIKSLASFFGVHTRTLQRRLAENGTSYSQIVGEVRMDRALNLLRDKHLTLSEISKVLGYSDPANFTRAFFRWKGMTPGTYRKRFLKNR